MIIKIVNKSMNKTCLISIKKKKKKAKKQLSQKEKEHPIKVSKSALIS